MPEKRKRIPFDSLTLCAVVAEAQAYIGGKVQRIWQPDESTVVFAIYRNGREAMFLLSCHPTYFRCHFVTKRASNPQPFPQLLTALRAHVADSHLTGVTQIGFDRILELRFSKAGEEFRLVAELMGKHSNLMFMDQDLRLLAAAKWVGPSKSKRPIQAGKTYAPPPFKHKPPIAEAKDLNDIESYQGASPHLVELLRAQGPEALATLRETIVRSMYAPVLVPGRGAYPISLSPLGIEELHRPSISIALEQHYDQAIADDAVELRRSALASQLQRVLTAREHALVDLRAAENAATTAGEKQLRGELILAYGAQLPEAATELAVTDYEGKPITITLEPEKDYKENAASYFDKARRAKLGAGIVRQQIVRMTEDQLDLREMLDRLRAAKLLPEIEKVQAEADKRKWLHKQNPSAAANKEERPYEGHRVREALAPNGSIILYGENAEANDYLLIRVAKPNDYWLHIRGSQSAHVVVPTQNKPERISKETLQYAATIAVRNSPSKHAGYVAVDYTLRKYVRKPRGAPKGSAIYTHEKTLHVES